MENMINAHRFAGGRPEGTKMLQDITLHCMINNVTMDCS
jgi:hypothetical protein